MTADTREELDTMAQQIGMNIGWIQHPGLWNEHYDITESRRALAVSAGAVEVDFRERTLEMLRQRRSNERGTKSGNES